MVSQNIQSKQGKSQKNKIESSLRACVNLSSIDLILTWTKNIMSSNQPTKKQRK